MAISTQTSENTKKCSSWDEVEIASRHEVIVSNGYPLDILATPEDIRISPYVSHQIQDRRSGSQSLV